MKLRVEETSLKGVLQISPISHFEDFRGDYTETYNEAAYHAAGITDKFIQDDMSVTHKHVLRGIHGDNGTAKLVSCPFGKIYLVVVNNDPESEQYKQWTAHTLSDQNKLQIYIPPKFGNSFLAMSDLALFHYKQTTYYGDYEQFTLKWDDPELNIWWPINNPITSKRDASD